MALSVCFAILLATASLLLIVLIESVLRFPVIDCKAPLCLLTFALDRFTNIGASRIDVALERLWPHVETITRGRSALEVKRNKQHTYS
jgi:hypothetical protein